MAGKPNIECAILEHCLADFTSITSLIGKVAESSTLYRYKDHLVKLGLLDMDGKDRYKTTPSGILELEVLRGRSPSGLFDVYPPLKQVPTHHHRAFIELGLSAVIARKFDLRTDRHPALVLAGPTLGWKTSCGAFLCYMVGLDPAKQVVNLAAESGRSLWLRKDSTGQIIYKRQLLSSDLIIFDEFQAADPQTRKFLSVFIDGRKTVNIENQQLIMHSTPFLTLNPKEASTLEERLGLNTPQIRRSITCDLTKIRVPDLAVKGEEILMSAKAYGGLRLQRPQASCEGIKEEAYSLFRACLNPKGLELVDFETLLMLSSAMTSYRDPVEALRLVFYDAMLLSETLGWTQLGWVTHVNAFLRETKSSSLTTPPDRNEQVLEETKIQAFKLLDAGGSTTELVTNLHIPFDRAESIVKEYVDINAGDLKLSELRRKRAEQELPFDVDSRLASLSATIEDLGSWKQENCTYLSNNYCMCWRWDEKPDIPDQIGEPLQKKDGWFVHPTYTRCALCPAYKERNTPSIEKVASSVKRLARKVDANTAEYLDDHIKLDDLLSEVQLKGNFKMQNCRHCDPTGFCRYWLFTLADGSKVNKKPTTRQCALCPGFSQRQQQ